jgi:signal transduction histidine kinase
MPERPELREELASEEASRFRAFQVGRIAVITSAVIALVLIDLIGGTTPEVRGLLGLVLVGFVLTVPYQWLARRFPDHLSTLSLGIMFAEGGFLTAAAYLLGESAVFVLPLYVGLVVRAALAHSARGSYAVAAFVIIAYGSMATLIGLDWIPLREGPFDFEFSDSWPWVTTILNAVVCTALALAVSSLSETTRRALAHSRTLESELRDLNRSLEERIADGVQEIRRANVGLALKNEQLERTLKQLNLFAGAISHDLRNPITGAGEVLRVVEGAEPERRELLLSLARENLLRADEMLIGLRNLMRTVGTSRESSMTAVRPIIEQVVEEIQTSRGERPVSIQLTGGFGVVEASPEQLAHVFRNLILNALEHNEGKGDLAIEIGQYERGEEVSFFVRDNGAGVPYELQSRIFEPFYRGPGRREESLGLGLALVQAIVSQAGGKVWMDSAPGEGATVRFSLPRCHEENT